MAQTRALVKRRKAIRNIRKITRTMNMIATAKYQRALRRSVGAKPYTLKLRELAHELEANVGSVQHLLLRHPEQETRSNRIALLVITSNRGLAGAYNGSVLRVALAFYRSQRDAGREIELHTCGKKGYSFFNYQKVPVARRHDRLIESPAYGDIEPLANYFIDEFTAARLDAVHVAYMNFLSAGMQRPEVCTLLPLSGLRETMEAMARQQAEKEAQVAAGVMDMKRTSMDVVVEPHELAAQTMYEFSPSAQALLDDVLPRAVRLTLFQCFLDAAASENVARMVAMKSATDNADKLIRSLTMQYNRARQAQITTELSEIMGGVEAMKR